MKERIRLGYWDRTCRQHLFYPHEAHGLLCAPARSGKFRDVLCPMLLWWKGSCLIIDPKGQAAAVTARYRRDVLGQEVHLLNPFNILPDYLGRFNHATYDPMASLDVTSPNFGTDANNIAESLLVHGGPDNHWVDSGRILTSGVAMAQKAYFKNVNLTTVYRLISGPHPLEFCRNMVDRGGNNFIVERLARFAQPDSAENREIRSIISAAITQLAFIGSQPIAENLKSSSFSFREMKKRPMSIYLILPGRYLATTSKFFRLIVASAIDAFLHEGERDVPILGVLDEFASAVGQLGVVETAMGLAAGYGLQLLPVLQDLSQLQGLYPKTWETFLANSGFRMFFAPRDKTTSEYVSWMTGDTEIPNISSSFGQGRNGESTVNTTSGQGSRRYLLPHEVRELPGDEMIVFGDGLSGVLRAGRRPYYASPELNGLCDPDPYHLPEPSQAPVASARTGFWRWLLG